MRSILGLVGEGFKDKFLTVCFGALLISILYVWQSEIIRSYIIIEGMAYFTYTATFVMLLSMTYIAHAITKVTNFLASLAAHCWEIAVLKNKIKSVNDEEIKVLAQIVLGNRKRRELSKDGLKVFPNLERYGFVEDQTVPMNSKTHVDYTFRFPDNFYKLNGEKRYDFIMKLAKKRGLNDR